MGFFGERLMVRGPSPPGQFHGDPNVLKLSAHRLAIAASAGLAAAFLPLTAAAQPSQAGQAAAPAPQTLTRSALANQLDSNFKAMDSNGDKSVSAAELEAAQKTQMARVSAALASRLDAQFAKLDSNKDGQLSPAEFRAAAPSPRVKPAAEMLAEFDRNKDGKVTIDEHRAGPLANFDRLDADKNGTLSPQEQSAARNRR